MIDGKNSYYFDKRTKPNSILWFNVKDEEKEDAIKALFDKNNIVFNFHNKYKDFSLTIDKKFICDNKNIILELHKLRYKEYKTEELI